MTKIGVLVVEDSLTVRKRLVEILQADPDLTVIAEAEDGKQAIELCERLRPDVITLDMVLPMMTGLAATEHIMAFCPTPIVIVSASANRGELFDTYDALAAGALDVLEKPADGVALPDWERQLIATVKLVARVKVITHPRGRLKKPACAPGAAASPRSPTPPYRCVAIGASTGGPPALAAVLAALPADFPLPLLLVMHITPAFSGAFADWLSDQSAIPVTLAQDGQALPAVGQPGALLAPPDKHLIVTGERIALTDDPEVHSCRPSVDVLFQSLAEQVGRRAVGVLLTGMGRDGARGLLAMRTAGALTIAQDEATSVVFGMPREAIALGGAQRVLPLEEMAPFLLALTNADDRQARRS